MNLWSIVLLWNSVLPVADSRWSRVPSAENKIAGVLSAVDCMDEVVRCQQLSGWSSVLSAVDSGWSNVLSAVDSGWTYEAVCYQQ